MFHWLVMIKIMRVLSCEMSFPLLRFLYNRSGEWSDGTVPILATTAAGFTYIAFLMVGLTSDVKHAVFIIMPYESFSFFACVVTHSNYYIWRCCASWDLRLQTWPEFCTYVLCLLFLLCQILALCHIALGQQLNLHWLHKVRCQMWAV